MLIAITKVIYNYKMKYLPRGRWLLLQNLVFLLNHMVPSAPPVLVVLKASPRGSWQISWNRDGWLGLTRGQTPLFCGHWRLYTDLPLMTPLMVVSRLDCQGNLCEEQLNIERHTKDRYSSMNGLTKATDVTMSPRSTAACLLRSLSWPWREK